VSSENGCLVLVPGRSFLNEKAVIFALFPWDSWMKRI